MHNINICGHAADQVIDLKRATLNGELPSNQNEESLTIKVEVSLPSIMNLNIFMNLNFELHFLILLCILGSKLLSFQLIMKHMSLFILLENVH